MAGTGMKVELSFLFWFFLKFESWDVRTQAELSNLLKLDVKR